jgi:hypothetical protein
MVKSYFDSAPEETSQEGLARAPSPPCLSHTPRRRDHPVTSPARGLYQCRDLTIAAIEGDEAASVEDETHLGGA